MAVRYRVVAFRKPRGPWRPTRRQAQHDAISQGLGDFDEWGAFYLDGYADIEWEYEDEVRRSA